MATLTQEEKIALANRMRQDLKDRMEKDDEPEIDPIYGVYDPSEGNVDMVDLTRKRRITELAKGHRLQKYAKAIDKLQPDKRPFSNVDASLRASMPTVPVAGTSAPLLVPCPAHPDTPNDACLACRRHQTAVTARADASGSTELPAPSGVYQVGGSSSSSGCTAPSNAVSHAQPTTDPEDERAFRAWLLQEQDRLNDIDLKKRNEAGAKASAKTAAKAAAKAAKQLTIATPKPKGRPRADGLAPGSVPKVAPKTAPKHNGLSQGPLVLHPPNRKRMMGKMPAEPAKTEKMQRTLSFSNAPVVITTPAVPVEPVVVPSPVIDCDAVTPLLPEAMQIATIDTVDMTEADVVPKAGVELPLAPSEYIVPAEFDDYVPEDFYL